MKRKVFILLLGILSIQLPSLAFKTSKTKKKINVNSLYPNTRIFYNVRDAVPTFYNFGCKVGFDHIGFKQTAGVNTSQFSIPGINLGVYLNIKSSEHFSYRHELLLAYGIFQKNSQKNVYCSRIDIPWQVNYHFSARNMLSVGMVPTIILSSSSTVPNQEAASNNEIDPIQLGAYVGLELAVSERMGFGLRFANYLNNVNNPEKDSGFNGMVQMYLNYSISNTFKYDKKLMSFRYERYEK